MTKVIFNGLSEGKTYKQLRQEKFQREFGVECITKENVKQIIEHINDMTKKCIVRFRLDLSRRDYKQALADNDKEKISLYEEVLAGTDSLNSGSGGTNESEYRGHNWNGKK